MSELLAPIAYETSIFEKYHIEDAYRKHMVGYVCATIACHMGQKIMFRILHATFEN